MTAAEITALKLLITKSFKVVPGGATGPVNGTRSRDVITILYALVDAIAAAGGNATAPQWKAGAQSAYSLVYDDGIVYLVLQNLANSTLRPVNFSDAYLPIGPGASGAVPVALQTYTVSLSGGKTAGTIKNGDVILKGTPYDDSFWRRVLVEDIFPTYTPGSVSVSQSAPADGEVGESISNTITGAFNQGDAGAVTAMRLYRGNQAQIGASATASPITRTTQMVRSLTPTGIWAVADYAAGAIKTVSPGNTPDPRTPAVRNPNAPQAAEVGLSSSIIYFTGYRKNFYGPASAVPATSADVRLLSGFQLTNGAKQFVLNTGNTQRIFVIELAPGQTLVSVIDQDALNKDITAEYVAGSAIQVADAGGNTSDYTPRVKVQAAPYDTNHRHLVTLG